MFKKRLFEYLLLNIIILIMELILNLIIFSSLTTYFFLELSLILIITSPILICRHEIAVIIYSTIILVFYCIFFYTNINMDYASNDIFTLKYIILAKEAGTVMSLAFINIWYILLDIFIAINFYVFLFLIIKFVKVNKKNMNKNIMFFILVLFISFSIRIINLTNIKEENKNHDMFKDLSSSEIMMKYSENLKKASLKNFGLTNYIISDFNNVYYFSNNIKIEEDYSNETLLTSKLKNFNVLEIMIETGTNEVVDKYLTPNLYKLKNEGINFTKCFSKNKTNISEFIGINGSVINGVHIKAPKSPLSLPNILKELGNYETNFFHENYANYYGRYDVMKNLGFENTYFIKHEDDEYENIKYIANEYEWHNEFNGNYPLDSDYVELAKKYMIPEGDNPFYTFYTSLTMHGPYTYDILDEKSNYKEEYNKLKEIENKGLWVNPCINDPIDIQKEFELYQAKTMNLDKAIGILLNRLEKLDKLNNTLIILYGDHECYYKTDNLSGKTMNDYIFGLNNYKNPNNYNTYLVFSNPILTNLIKDNINLYHGFENIDNKLIYSDIVSPYIIVPTVLDLLGIKYNQNLYVGKSIFQILNNDNYNLSNIFYSHELEFIISDKLLAYTYDNYSYIFEADEIYKKEFNLNLEKIMKKIDLLNSIYGNNYFEKENNFNNILNTFKYHI